MGVNLSGANVGVAEHGLDRADVGTVHEEIGGEAVAESMRGDMFGDAGRAGVFFDNTFNRAGSEPAKVARGINGALTATVVEKKRG